MNGWMKFVVAAGLSAMAGGCATFHAYDGPRLAPDVYAVVVGDAKFRAITPLTAVIRSVDGRTVDIRFNSVALTPGTHELIVDCQVGTGANASLSRHVVRAEVAPGGRYRLRAETGPGNQSCERVYLDPV